MGFGRGKGEGLTEHPCLALKKLLSSGTFYYSSDFDLTRRLQERYAASLLSLFLGPCQAWSDV